MLPRGEDVEVTEQDLVGASFNEASMELVLANGSRCGHRALRRYYQQHFQRVDVRDSVLTQQMYNRYWREAPQEFYMQSMYPLCLLITFFFFLTPAFILAARP